MPSDPAIEITLRLIRLTRGRASSAWLPAAVAELGGDESTLDAARIAGLIERDDADWALTPMALSLETEPPDPALSRIALSAMDEHELDERRRSRDAAPHRVALGEWSTVRSELVQVATRAEGHGEIDAALDAYSLIIDLAPDAHAADTRETRVRRAVVAGRDERARDQSTRWWLEILEDARIRDSSEDMARALYHLYWVENDSRNTARLQEASQLDDGTVGWAARAAAYLHVLEDEYDAAERRCRVALRLARAHGWQYLEALCLDLLSFSFGMTGRITEMVPLLRQSIEIAIELNDVENLAITSVNLVEALCMLGELDEALSQSQRLVVRLEQFGSPTWLTMARGYVVATHTRRGELVEAWQTAQKIWHTADSQSEASAGNTYALLACAEAALDLGNVDDLSMLIDRVTAAGGSRNEGRFDHEIRWLALRSMLVDPAATVEQVLHEITQLGDLDEDWLSVTIALGLARAGALRDLPELTARAVQITEDIDGTSSPFVATGMEEVAAHATIDAAERRTLLLRSSRSWTRTGYRLDAARAHACAALAATLCDTADQASHRLASAISMLRECGADPDADALYAASRGRLGSLALVDVDAHVLTVGVPPHIRFELEREARVRTFPAGSTIFDEDQPGDEVLLVMSGHAKLAVQTAEGRSLTIELRGNGDVIGEHLLVADEAGCRAPWTTVIAHSEVTAAGIPAARFRSLLEHDSQLAYRMFSVVAADVRAMAHQTESIAFWSVEQRVAHLLLSLDDRFGHPTLSGDRVINVRMTQTDVADMVGATRKSVTLLMSTLRSEGTIDTIKRRVHILDRGALERRIPDRHVQDMRKAS